jgi:hypothetical protein
MIDYISICAIIKDEHPDDILEWVNYHRKIGVNRFYIYDNDSEISIAKILEGYKDVVVFPIYGIAMQYMAYKHCIEYVTKNNYTYWLAIIDLDEFICPMKSPYLDSILIQYENYAGLCANWAMFGSNGHKEHQNSVLQSYTTRMNPELEETKILCSHVKTILKPSLVMGINNPHSFQYKEGYFAVGENFVRIDSFQRLPVTYDKIRINHYFTKSREDFEKKVSRPRADIGKIRKDHEVHWNTFEKYCNVEDVRILEI